MENRFKFKFWNIKEKKFFEPIPTEQWLAIDDGRVYLYERDFSDNRELVEVTEVTEYYIPMQSTGLSDVNNKLIYENDIIKYKIECDCNGVWYDFIGTVKYINGSFIIEDIADKKNSFGLDDDLTIHFSHLKGDKTIISEIYLEPDNFEIIGNIYENKELIGE
jgi:uncharacterized phage protein (TIGR01671 family)